MNVKMVLFDLDGTLLPMDQDKFIQHYFGILAKKAAPFGYEAKKLINTVWAGTHAMIENDGSRSNEEAFWEAYAQVYGEEALKDRVIFDEFYANEFSQTRASSAPNEVSAKLIGALKAKGYRCALATNPIFPFRAIEERLSWLNIETQSFELITSYENSRYSKPNLSYYLEIAEKLEVSPKECLMVGNDVSDDMPARNCGMKVFLLTDCMINPHNEDISVYPHGGFPELAQFLNLEL